MADNLGFLESRPGGKPMSEWAPIEVLGTVQDDEDDEDIYDDDFDFEEDARDAARFRKAHRPEDD